MKKTLLSAVVVALVSWSTGMAGTVLIANSLQYVYRSALDGGGLIPKANNWVIAVYQDDGNPGMDPYNPLISPIATLQGGAWYDDGLFSGSFASDGGISIFTRIYNSSSIGTPGSYWINLSGGVTDVTPMDAKGTFPYDPGGNTDNGTWQPIPEPGTLALFGLGAVTLAVRKRLRKK